MILAPEACDGTTMAWDYDRALRVLRASGVVRAVVCGHDHKGRYHQDEHGIHHLTLCSPLNLGDEGAAYGAVDVFDDRIELRGPKLADLLPDRDGSVTPRPPLLREPGAPCDIMRFPLAAAPPAHAANIAEDEDDEED